MRKAPFATVATACALSALCGTNASEFGQEAVSSLMFATSYEGQKNPADPADVCDITHVNDLITKYEAACLTNDARQSMEAEQELTMMADSEGWNITIQECVAGRPFTIGPFYPQNLFI